MEAYEDNLEKINEHKKTVRETTKATRDFTYKDTNTKIRDYERESRRNVDTVPSVPAPVPAPASSTYSHTSSYRSSAVIEDYEPESKPVRGNWRKDMEKFEQKLEKKKTEEVKPRAAVTSFITSSFTILRLTRFFSCTGNIPGKWKARCPSATRAVKKCLSLSPFSFSLISSSTLENT